MEDGARAAARRFRAAFEQGGLSHVTFGGFPRGSCGDACELLGEYLRDCGLGDWTYRSGWRGSSSHAWLEKDGLIVDVTADQFNDGQPAVLVTRDGTWHSEFAPMGAGRTAGLDYYSADAPGEPLRQDYEVLRARADGVPG